MDFSRQLDRAEALYSQGLKDQAAEIFELILKYEPDNPRALNDLGVFHHRGGRAAEAESLFRRALSVRPEHADALRNLAALCEETGRAAEALELYDKARKVERGSGDSGDKPREPETERVSAPAPASEVSANLPPETPVNWDPTPTQPKEQPVRTLVSEAADLRPLNILFVQDAPCIRNYKMATALRSRGHRISLAYTRARLSQVYPALSDDVYHQCIPLKGLRHLWDLSAGYDLIHCHNEPDQLTVAALAGKTPVIHDTHDLISLRHGGDSNLVYLEGIANRGAAGRIYVSSYQRDQALTLYGIDLETSAVVHNYVLRAMVPEAGLPKLSSGDGEIHVVYEGGLGSVRVPHRYYLPVFRELTSARIHLHMYPSFHNPEYEREASLNPYLHYHAPVSPERIVFEMTRYDFGIVPFVVTPENERHLHSAMPNKLFEYLAAGLPVIANDLQSIREFFGTHPVGVLYRNPGEIAEKIRSFSRSLPDNVPFIFEEQVGLVEAVYAKVLKEGRAQPEIVPANMTGFGTGPGSPNETAKPPSKPAGSGRRLRDALRQKLSELGMPENWKAYHPWDLEIFLENLRLRGEVVAEPTARSLREQERLYPLELREVLSVTPCVLPGFVGLLGSLCTKIARVAPDLLLKEPLEPRCSEWLDEHGVQAHAPAEWYRSRNLAPEASSLLPFLVEENTYLASCWLDRYLGGKEPVMEQRFRQAYDYVIGCLNRAGIPGKEPMFRSGAAGLLQLNVPLLRFLDLSFRAAKAINDESGSDLREKSLQNLMEALAGLEFNKDSIPEGDELRAYRTYALLFERLNLLHQISLSSGYAGLKDRINNLFSDITSSFWSMEAAASGMGGGNFHSRLAWMGYLESILSREDAERVLEQDSLRNVFEGLFPLPGGPDDLPEGRQSLFGCDRIHGLSSLVEWQALAEVSGDADSNSGISSRTRNEKPTRSTDLFGAVRPETQPGEGILCRRPLEG